MSHQSQSKRAESIKCFIKASEFERLGDIGKAMELYKRAYTLDPDVESNIDYEQIQPPQIHPNRTDKAVEEEIEARFDINEPDHVCDVITTISSTQPLGLDDDVLIRIIKHSGTFYAPTVDIFGATCKKMYVLTRDEAVWKHLTQLASASSSKISLDPVYSSYRRMFLLRPRLRTDALYIAKITYFRPGYSDTTISNPVHLVTYYRYLRFFGAAQGYRVWWLVSSKPPKEVLDLLRHPYQSKSNYFSGSENGQISNMFQGTYQRSAIDDSKQFQLVLRNIKHASGMSWCMAVQLQYPTRMPPHRHAILRCIRYVPLTGEQHPIDIAEWGRFYFSKVRSYKS